MQHLFRGKSILLILFIAVASVSISSFYGCDDAGVTEDPVVSYVVHFDSIGVEEFINGQSRSGMNLFFGTNDSAGSNTKDVVLRDSLSLFTNFYLSSGDQFDIPLAGYETKFTRIYSDMTRADFDTITVIPDSDTTLQESDFFYNNTFGGIGLPNETHQYGFFTYPMNSYPVYAFYLKGQSGSGVTGGFSIFGIFRPIESFDSTPSSAGGFRMSFEVRINTHGINDFKHLAH